MSPEETPEAVPTDAEMPVEETQTEEVAETTEEEDPNEEVAQEEAPTETEGE